MANLSLLEGLNWTRIIEILDETTIFLRTEPLHEQRNVGKMEVHEFYLMSTVEEGMGRFPNLKIEDVIFFNVGIHADKAEALRAELVELLRPASSVFEEGPSYTHFGNCIEQQTALRLFGLGKYLGFWDIFSGRSLGMEARKTEELARGGFLMAAGWKVDMPRPVTA